MVRSSAILLHTLPVSAQRDYNAIDAEDHRGTWTKSLKSTSNRSQPNIRQVADVPDSKSGPRKRVWVQVPPSLLNRLRHPNPPKDVRAQRLREALRGWIFGSGAFIVRVRPTVRG